LSLRAEIVEHMADIDAAEWGALAADENPFLSHAFLETLEYCRCVGGDTGWYPHHLVIRDPRGRLIAAMPQYLKQHSWGEFIFDWSWAQASTRAGIEYYPKLLSAVPFTPVTGPRMLIRGDADRGAMQRELPDLLKEAARSIGASGAHVNFTTAEEQAALEAAGFTRRHDCRFLWRNRNYRNFDDFLERMRSDKRKKVRRERRRVVENGISIRTLAGEDLPTKTWEQVFGFSEQTFLRHGMSHYLNPSFFERLARLQPGTVMVKVAEQGGKPRATAIFLQGGGALYGRYWGSDEYLDCLHFELCYYQGIEHSIEMGLSSFDPGTQGEHKLARGFEPTVTTSAHWLAHEGLANAIRRHLERERAAVDEYVATASSHMPFKRGEAS
jgi:hypothetical protein